VQQPDRSLCNFQFVVIPIAVLMLEALPGWLCVMFIASFGAANLRLGEPQPALLLELRLVMLAISLLIALYAVAATVKSRRAGATPVEQA
jgi:hypothetical protein